MAWYDSGGWDYYPPYVSVAEKKAHGARALAKLLKKSKRRAEPVVIAHRKRQLTTTFWGKAWSDNLERYADLANRLPRGRAYLRNGSVLDLAIAGGRVGAVLRAPPGGPGGAAQLGHRRRRVARAPGRGQAHRRRSPVRGVRDRAGGRAVGAGGSCGPPVAPRHAPAIPRLRPETLSTRRCPRARGGRDVGAG